MLAACADPESHLSLTAFVSCFSSKELSKAHHWLIPFCPQNHPAKLPRLINNGCAICFIAMLELEFKPPLSKTTTTRLNILTSWRPNKKRGEVTSATPANEAHIITVNQSGKVKSCAFSEMTISTLDRNWMLALETFCTTPGTSTLVDESITKQGTPTKSPKVLYN